MLEMLETIAKIDWGQLIEVPMPMVMFIMDQLYPEKCLQTANEDIAGPMLFITANEDD